MPGREKRCNNWLAPRSSERNRQFFKAPVIKKSPINLDIKVNSNYKQLKLIQALLKFAHYPSDKGQKSSAN